LLRDEATALKILNIPDVPSLIYFDDSRIDGRKWILETYVEGVPVDGRLTLTQMENAGRMFAQIHSHKNGKKGIDLDFLFSDFTKSFGSRDFLKKHPDERLRSAISMFFYNLESNSVMLADVEQSLIHGDATMSNFLGMGDKVGLIDWEFSRFSDPMQDFSTMFYEDIAYNRGKWRIKISSKEKNALKKSYEEAGGTWDERRLKFWILVDKLGAAIFLYWRINTCDHPTEPERMAQYKLDYETISNSLSSQYGY